MRGYRLMTVGAVAALATALLAGSPAAATATDTATGYSFDLVGANTAVSPDGGTMASPGDRISVTGSGTFDPAAGTVRAKGRFVHYSSTGTVMCQGTWKATGLTGFTGFGTDDQGTAGGVVSMTVSHYCTTMGMTMPGIPMTVTSTVNAPAGYTEGVTMGEFTQPTGGTVVIQPEQ